MHRLVLFTGCFCNLVELLVFTLLAVACSLFTSLCSICYAVFCHERLCKRASQFCYNVLFICMQFLNWVLFYVTKESQFAYDLYSYQSLLKACFLLHTCLFTYALLYCSLYVISYIIMTDHYVWTPSPKHGGCYFVLHFYLFIHDFLKLLQLVVSQQFIIKLLLQIFDLFVTLQSINNKYPFFACYLVYYKQ